VSGALQVLGEERIRLLGHAWSLGNVSGILLYLLGFAGEVMLLTSIYLVMPVGRLSLRHALIGGLTAAVLWEITRHLLVWYLASLSQVSIVYGSLTTTIIVLLSLEIGAILLLYGAQVIAEYEHVANAERDAPVQEFHTDSV
jgi:membrane protein